MRAGSLLGLVLAGAQVVVAHGDHSKSKKPEVAPDANWMTKHMAGKFSYALLYSRASNISPEEHHVENWDAGSFFTLHDYNSDGLWQGEEILRTYGLYDESNKDVSHTKREELLSTLMKLMDRNDDDIISKDEWLAYIKEGKTLPDLGTGPGHHGDDEYEYEIHHWEKYHDENTKLEDLTHPEDIEHFKKHEEMEDAQDRLDAMAKQSIIEENIPQKFRRN